MCRSGILLSYFYLFVVTSLFSPFASADEKVLPIVDVFVTGGNNRSLAQMSAFIPIRETSTDMIFGDVRFMHHLSGSKKKDGISLYKNDTYEGNIGIGYRFVNNSENVVGCVGYYDIRRSQLKKTAILSQATLNFHFITPSWQTNLNAYLPINKKKISKHYDELTDQAQVFNHSVYFLSNRTTITEKSTTGFDLHIMSKQEKFRFGPVVYYFKGAKSIAGGGVEAQWNVNNVFGLEASYTYDKVRKSNFMVGLRFNILGSQQEEQLSSVQQLISQRVKRDIDMVTVVERSPQMQVLTPQPDVAIFKNGSSLGNDYASLALKLQSMPKDGKVLLVTSDKFTVNSQTPIMSYSVLQQEIGTAKTKLKNTKRVGSQLDVLVRQEKDPVKRAVSSAAVLELDASLMKQLRQKYITDFGKNNNNSDKMQVNIPGQGVVTIDRAGVLILSKDKNGQYVIPLGFTKKTPSRLEWFSGGVNVVDNKSRYSTAQRELFEETRALVATSPEALKQLESQGCFVYNRQTYIVVYPDASGRYSADTLNRQSENNLPYPFKEVKSYVDVPLQTFQNAVNSGNRNMPQGSITGQYFRTLNSARIRVVNAINAAKKLM